MTKVVVADNGAFHLRLGYAEDPGPTIICPNQIAIIRGDGRELVGEETESSTLAHHEMLEYRRPHQRGLWRAMLFCRNKSSRC